MRRARALRINTRKLHRINAYLLFILAHSLKFNFAVCSCKQSIVASSGNIKTGMNVCSSLSYENISGQNSLTVSSLDTKSFRLGISAVLCAADTFFVRKKLYV